MGADHLKFNQGCQKAWKPGKTWNLRSFEKKNCENL